jgi:hypothetical protein
MRTTASRHGTACKPPTPCPAPTPPPPHCPSCPACGASERPKFNPTCSIAKLSRWPPAVAPAPLPQSETLPRGQVAARLGSARHQKRSPDGSCLVARQMSTQLEVHRREREAEGSLLAFAGRGQPTDPALRQGDVAFGGGCKPMPPRDSTKLRKGRYRYDHPATSPRVDEQKSRQAAVCHGTGTAQHARPRRAQQRPPRTQDVFGDSETNSGHVAHLGCPLPAAVGAKK